MFGWGWRRRVATAGQYYTTTPDRYFRTINAGDIFIKYNFAGERRSLPKPAKPI
jgi:hypothetical protein